MYADRGCSLTTLQIAVHCRPMPSSHTSHPSGLYLLFFVEMWERFSYYGMRSLLVLYLISDQSWADDRAYSLYGTYTSLVYVTPLIGGWLADRFARYPTLACHRRHDHRAWTLLARLLRIGDDTLLSGFSHSSLLERDFLSPTSRQLWANCMRHTIHDGMLDLPPFIMGINLGALLGTLICGYLGERVGWHWGFGSAGIGMLCGMIGFMIFRSRYLAGIGNPPLSKTARDVASHSQTADIRGTAACRRPLYRCHFL